MPRRSILTPVREGRPDPEPVIAPGGEGAPKRTSSVKPSRKAQLHIGGYYPPEEPIIIAFQKLGIDLRKTQQEMLLEALSDFVAKHEAENAFR